MIFLIFACFVVNVLSCQQIDDTWFDDIPCYFKQAIYAVDEECNKTSPELSKIESQAVQLIQRTTREVLAQEDIHKQDFMEYFISYPIYLAFSAVFTAQEFDDCYMRMYQYLDLNQLKFSKSNEDDEVVVLDYDKSVVDIQNAFVNNPGCFAAVLEGLLTSVDSCWQSISLQKQI